MKTKKILAITLSCLLLIGAMVGFTVSAAEGASVAISGVNVSYEGAIKLVYTLDSANVPEGGAAKVVFSFDENVTVQTGEALNEELYEYVNGLTVYEENEAVFSEGFAPADMTKTVYAIPIIVDADNSVVAAGKAVSSSIYDYFMARINGGTATTKQNELYVAALDFGGFVQEAQKITEGKDPVGGHYANEYYQLKKIDETGALITETYSKPTEVNLVAPKGNSENKLFDHFADKDGVVYENADFNKLTLTVDKIGTTYVEYVYGDTSINVEGITGTASSSATLANPDTDVVVKGGTEYYLDADVTLTAGAVAALDFMADDATKIGTVNFSEAEGVVTVSDGISSFTMANGANLKIEYTVISATANTGAIFYYVDGAYVAVSQIPAVDGTSNAAFAKVVASATAGEIAVTNALVGANDGVVTIGTNSYVTSVEYLYDADYGKSFKLTKKEGDGGSFTFDIAGTVNDAGTTVLEAKVKLSGFATAGTWRNYIDLSVQHGAGGNISGLHGTRLAFVPTGIVWGGNGSAAVTHPYGTTAIATGEWFDLKIEHVGSKEFNIYVNGVQVYHVSNGTSAMDVFKMTLGNTGGYVQMADVKYYNK